ncbi:MAG: alpha/beta fold hydrolase [Anaerolineae bacterium]|jgi:3-oxoadipate enol-lactonase|nr:alpha/beta fold hydrolase [Anaerolineae bacterium]
MERTVNGVRLAVREAGAAEKPALLLIHGFPLDSAMWDAQLSGLAQHCRVVAPDLRGHGASDAPPGPYSIDQHADDLAALLDALGIQRAVVGGLSMGGYVALSVWRRHPARVSALALIDTRANADTPEAKAAREATIGRIRERGVAVLAEEMLPRLLAPENQGKTEIERAVREMILRQPVEGMAGALEAMRDRADATDLLTGVTVPAAVIVGEADVITPVSVAEDLARRLPDARLVVVPRAGHMAPVEAPQEVNAALLELARRTG